MIRHSKMLLWTFWWIAVSLMLILLIHYLYTYLKDTLTVPIVEEVATKNKKRYDDMLAPIRSETNVLPTTTETIKTPDTNSMKDELQAFLNELKNNDENSADDTTPLSPAI